LTRKILNKKIIKVIIRDPRVVKKPSLAQFKKGVEKTSIKEVFRRAKVLILGLSNGKYLIIHLRIAGWLLYGEEEQKARMAFKLRDGSFLNYMDQRVLGELHLLNHYLEHSFIKRLGPEPFKINPQQFEKELQTRKTPVKEAIKHRGSSVDIYRNTNGQKGGMEERLLVYGRKGEPCRACKKPIDKVSMAGRGTCFCPRCQK